jgi:hypothetical protein
MRLKLLFFFVCLLSLQSETFAQSIYQLKYNYHSSRDTTTYNAFFILYEDGSGFMRTVYQTPEDKKDMLVEMDLDQEIITDKNDKPDTKKIYITTINPNIIQTDFAQHPDTPVFLFTYNNKTKFMEPSKLVSIDPNGKKYINPKSTLIAKQLDRNTITESFLSNYFSPFDSFFVYFNKMQTRSILPPAKDITMHLIIVAGTLDPHIGKECQMDAKRTIDLYTGIKNYLGFQLKIYTIDGQQFSSKNVLDTLDKIKPNPQDIMVFYYTGHGFRMTDDSHLFPYMDLRIDSTKNHITSSLSMERVDSIIRTKNARLNLVFSDCCNADVLAPKIVAPAPMKVKSGGVFWNDINCRNLFLNNNPMSILATAAESGQYATSNPQFGGFFSFFYKSSLEGFCSGPKFFVTWDLILQEVQNNTVKLANRIYCSEPKIPSNKCKQFPYYIIH